MPPAGSYCPLVVTPGIASKPWVRFRSCRLSVADAEIWRNGLAQHIRRVPTHTFPLRWLVRTLCGFDSYVQRKRVTADLQREAETIMVWGQWFLRGLDISSPPAGRRDVNTGMFKSQWTPNHFSFVLNVVICLIWWFVNICLISPLLK